MDGRHFDLPRPSLSALAPPPPIDLDTAAIDQILGAKESNSGGVSQFGIRRAEPIKAALAHINVAKS